MLTLRLTDSLQKVFSDAALPPERTELYLLSGERGNAQLVLLSDRDADVSVSVSGADARLFAVKEIYAGFPVREGAKNCTLLKDGKPGYYPDLLVPLAAKEPLPLQKDRLTAVWVEVPALPAGAHSVSLTVACGDETQRATLSVFVSKTALSEKKPVYTDWFHADCLASYYKVPVFSEAHWGILDRFLQNAAEHGVTLILTPLFTPALDTAVGHERPTTQLVGVKKTGDAYAFDFSRLRRWVDLCRSHGISQFEFSHFFTQWGAKCCPKVVAETDEGERRLFGWDTDALSPAYVAFLEALGKALFAFTEELGITKDCFVHVSDEPGADDLLQYEQCAAVIKRAFGAYRHLDALSDVDFYKRGLVEIPVPEEGSVEAFAALDVPEKWTYYCCGQYENELPNRFFAMPGMRTRILGALLYKYDCRGFLHWGFNFYYTQYSLREVDPFTETDAGGAFPSGDSFTVYPGKDGEPLPSLREKVFFDALQDYRALKALEERRGRGFALALLQNTLGDVRFTSYPMDEETFFAFRKALVTALETE